MKNKYEDLEKLNELLQREVISNEEYQKEKDKILNGNGATLGDPFFGLRENTYCMFIHLSLLLGLIHGVLGILGLLAPLLLWILNRDHSVNVDNHGRVVFNWIISFVIYLLVLSSLLMPLGFVLSVPFRLSPFMFFSGSFPVIVLVLLNVIFIVKGTMKAKDGVLWQYPLSIRFFKMQE